MSFPEDLKYSTEHEWVRQRSDGAGRHHRLRG